MMCVCHHAGKRRFLRWKTPFSPQENAVFTVVNSFGESYDVTTNPAVTSLCAAAPLPFGEGLGVGLAGLAGLEGFAATSHLAATTCMYLKHSGFGGLVAEWQQIL